MIEKITLALVSESGEIVPIKEMSPQKVEIKIDVAIADLFNAICYRNNNLKDAELKTAEKFHFALNLKNYLQEINDNEKPF